MASSETFMSFCLCREMPRRGVSTRPPYSGPVKAKGSGEPFFRNGETPRKLPPNLRQATQVFLGNFHRISAKRCAVFFGTSSEPLLYVAGFSRKHQKHFRQTLRDYAKKSGIISGKALPKVRHFAAISHLTPLENKQGGSNKEKFFEEYPPRFPHHPSVSQPVIVFRFSATA